MNNKKMKKGMSMKGQRTLAYIVLVLLSFLCLHLRSVCLYAVILCLRTACLRQLFILGDHRLCETLIRRRLITIRFIYDIRVIFFLCSLRLSPVLRCSA